MCIYFSGDRRRCQSLAVLDRAYDGKNGSLAFAAGAMMYLVNDELIPQSNSMHSHLANTGLIADLLIGFVML